MYDIEYSGLFPIQICSHCGDQNSYTNVNLCNAECRRINEEYLPIDTLTHSLTNTEQKEFVVSKTSYNGTQAHWLMRVRCLADMHTYCRRKYSEMHCKNDEHLPPC